MNSLEDQLTNATRAAASTVPEGSAPPLRLPETAFHPPRILAGRRPVMAPLAAGVAVAVLAVTAFAVRDAVTSDRSQATSATTGAAASVPPYFVAITGQHSSHAVVASSATGKVLASFAVPKPDNSFIAVSAAADDRTFVLTAQKVKLLKRKHSPIWLPVSTGPTRFFRLTFDPGGKHPAELTTLPIPVLPKGSYSLFNSIALSPSGTQLAVEVTKPHERNLTGIKVYSLATGKAATWYVPGHNAIGSPGLTAPAWDGGDQHLAVLYWTQAKQCVSACVDLLDPSKPGVLPTAPLFETSKIPVYAYWSAMVFTPDGSRMLLGGLAGKKAKKGISIFYRPLIGDVNLKTGQAVPLLLHGSNGANLTPVWTSPNGQVFIIARQDPADISFSATIYHAGKRTPLPLPPNTKRAAW